MESSARATINIVSALAMDIVEWPKTHSVLLFLTLSIEEIYESRY